MLTYALFIATDPDPVSSSDWSHLDQVYDRARLSSGGTLVKVRATEESGIEPEDFDLEIATFINGLHVEVRDDGPDAFAYLADREVIGRAQLNDGQWQLRRITDATLEAEPVAVVPSAGRPREEVEVALGKIVEDWLT